MSTWTLIILTALPQTYLVPIFNTIARNQTHRPLMLVSLVLLLVALVFWQQWYIPWRFTIWLRRKNVTLELGICLVLLHLTSHWSIQ